MNPFSEEKFNCPYCGSENSIAIETYIDSRQKLIQDCEICCNPISIQAKIRDGEIVDLHVVRENE